METESITVPDTLDGRGGGHQFRQQHRSDL